MIQPPSTCETEQLVYPPITYYCEYCPFRCHLQATFEKHIKHYHSNNSQNYSYNCMNTDLEVYDSKITKLSKENNVIRNDLEKTHKCEHCEYETYGLLMLILHTCFKENGFRCEVCERYYKTELLLLLLFNKHFKFKKSDKRNDSLSKIKTYGCTYCDYKAIEMEHIEKHSCRLKLTHVHPT